MKKTKREEREREKREREREKGRFFKAKKCREKGRESEREGGFDA